MSYLIRNFIYMLQNRTSLVLKSQTPKTYKSKKLNTANFGNFSHSDYQVFLHLVSKIGGVDEFGKYLQPEQLQREHVLTAKEFSEVFNCDIHNSYRMIHKACKKLMKTSISLERLELNEIWEINICSTAKYNKTEGRITILFTDSIMPYLAQVRERFVLYNLKEIANFGSLYTTRLYELIQEFKETGWTLKSIDQLRDIFAVGEKFKAYKDLKKRTFAHACQEINDNYDMDLRFEEIKEGRRVVAVKFLFKKTLVHKVTNRKTGIEKNVYVKPKARIKKKQSIPEVLEGQLSFDDLKDDPKSMKNVMSSILTKFFHSKK
jgi:plasmid replication initiation protein